MRLRVAATAALLSASVALAADWPQWGRDATRNAVSPEKNPPLDFVLPSETDKTGRNVAWKVDLERWSVVPPVIADGLVWVCTAARDPNGDEDTIPAKDWDGGVLVCYRESDGKRLWRHRTPRLAGKGCIRRTSPVPPSGRCRSSRGTACGTSTTAARSCASTSGR